MRDFGKRTDNINALILFATLWYLLFHLLLVRCYFGFWSGLTLQPEQDLKGTI